MQYKGWIPTVTCRLSFSTIGLSSHPTRCVSANAADGHCRYIVCYQSRNCLDAILPAGLSGKFWYLLLAKTEEYKNQVFEQLSGTVYLFHKKNDWVQNSKSIVRHAQDKLNEYQAHFQTTSIQEHFGSTFDGCIQNLDNHSTVKAKFQLLRNGEFTLEFDPDSDFSENAPKIPTNIAAGHIHQRILSQFFFFVRDICHKHQHHNPDTDTILDIYEATNDDITWRRETLYNLFRKIIRYKRGGDEETLYSAEGVLAYASAFKSLCKSVFENQKQPLPEYDVSSLTTSISAAQSTVQWRQQKRANRINTIFAVVIGVGGLVLALISIIGLIDIKLQTEPHPHLLFIAEKFLTSPYTTFSVVAVFGFAITVMAEGLDFRKHFFLRWIVRAFHKLPREFLILLFFISGVALLAATILLIHQSSL